ncbi:MAG: penicillin-binding transpeptidase domain-containing protein [Subdoligranulum sp.]
MSKGCIIVMRVGSGQILASTSMPEFDPDDIAASIRADDTSLINRSLSAFSAGSVFKVVLAAAAYAQGLDWFTYDCTGSIQTAGKPSAVRWGGRTAPSTCAARWNKAVTVTLLRWASCWVGRRF